MELCPDEGNDDDGVFDDGDKDVDDGSDGSNNNANDNDNDEYGKDIDDDDDDYDDENSSHVTSRLFFFYSSRRSSAKYPGLGHLRYFIRSVMAASSRAQWQARNVPFDLLHGP